MASLKNGGGIEYRKMLSFINCEHIVISIVFVIHPGLPNSSALIMRRRQISV